jgi:hypothetical protein
LFVGNFADLVHSHNNSLMRFNSLEKFKLSNIENDTHWKDIRFLQWNSRLNSSQIAKRVEDISNTVTSMMPSSEIMLWLFTSGDLFVHRDFEPERICVDDPRMMAMARLQRGLVIQIERPLRVTMLVQPRASLSKIVSHRWCRENGTANRQSGIGNKKKSFRLSIR